MRRMVFGGGLCILLATALVADDALKEATAKCGWF